MPGNRVTSSTKNMRTGILIIISICICGCAAKQTDFMGVPDEEKVTAGERNPQIDTRVQNMIVMTAVETVDYTRYKELKRKGKIIEEEKINGFIYFAVETVEVVHLNNAGPNSATGGAFTVTERYKTKVPNE